MSKLDDIEKELQRISKDIEALKNPGPKIGSFGAFWDYIREDALYGYLEGINENKVYKFHRKNGSSFLHFKPITEAILPEPVEYDGGEYPGNPDDLIMVEYQKGALGCNKAGILLWPDPYKKRYWIIKKA